MKIQYLGTAAAEGIPGMFCKCELCEKARVLKGKDIRTRSQSLIDGRLLIDFPPDTYMHAINYGLALQDIHTLIITHSHLDHLNEHDFWCRSHGIANNIEERPLDVFVTKSGYRRSADFISSMNVSESRICLHEITPFIPFTADGYTITPLPADHGQNTNPVIFIIEKDGKALLYSHDSGTYPSETVEYFKKSGKHFDLVSLDCTNCYLEYRGNHMGFTENFEVRDMLLQWGLCDEKTIFVSNHFSHNGAKTHEEMSEYVKEHGFIISYDTLEIEF